MQMLRPTVLLVFVLLAGGSACAAPVEGGRKTADEVAALRRANQDLTAEVARLRDNLVMLEARVLDQQRLVEELRAALAASRGGERPPLPASPGGAGNELFLRAFADYAAGRFAQAVAGFEAFLQGAPPAEAAASARFWLGEALAGQQQYALAVAEYRTLVAEHPQSPKAPVALLHMAEALQQLNLADQARAALETLRTRYPESDAARQLKAGK